MTNQNINFPRSCNGYDPQQVTAVIIELNKQIADWKNRHDLLSDTVTQYESKIKQLLQSTQQLQEERAKESLRLTGFMYQSKQMTEQIKKDSLNETNIIMEKAQLEASKLIESAAEEAETIRCQAKVDFTMALTAMNALRENTQSIRQSNERYIESANTQLSEIDMLINYALNGSSTHAEPQNIDT